MVDLASFSLGQARTQQSLIDKLTAALLRLVGDVDLRDPAATRRYANRAAEITAQAQMASGLSAWQAMGVMLRNLYRVNPPRGDWQMPSDLRGVRQSDVLRRPLAQWSRNVSEGMDEAKATATMEREIADAVEEDVRLAERRAIADRLESVPDVTGMRRIIHPERSRGGTCGLCAVAADRIYQKRDLLPIHTHCRCTVAPIVGEIDPGKSLNKADLAALYDEAGGTGKSALSNIRVKEVTHGELGARLVAA